MDMQRGVYQAVLELLGHPERSCQQELLARNEYLIPDPDSAHPGAVCGESYVCACVCMCVHVCACVCVCVFVRRGCEDHQATKFPGSAVTNIVNSHSIRYICAHTRHHLPEYAQRTQGTMMHGSTERHLGHNPDLIKVSGEGWADFGKQLRPEVEQQLRETMTTASARKQWQMADGVADAVADGGRRHGGHFRSKREEEGG